MKKRTIGIRNWIRSYYFRRQSHKKFSSLKWHQYLSLSALPLLQLLWRNSEFTYYENAVMVADLGKFLKNYFALGLCPLPFCHVAKKYILTYTKKKLLSVEDEFEKFFELLFLPSSPSFTFRYLTHSKDIVLSITWNIY